VDLDRRRAVTMAEVGEAAGYSRGIVTTSEAATFERRDGLFRGCCEEAIRGHD
jgi:hypothetical protein